MADINPPISVMTLNVKELTTVTKGRDCQTELKKKKKE